MAMEDAARFLVSLTDPTLIDELRRATDADSFAHAAVRAGTAAGMPFTENDVARLLDAALSEGGTLSDEALDTVSGGGSLYLSSSYYYYSYSYSWTMLGGGRPPPPPPPGGTGG